MLRRFLSGLPLFFLILAACGSKATTPSAVDSLCAATDPPKCIGNVSAACGPGGKSYVVTQCGVDKYCDATSGLCLATVCEKGSSKCTGDTSRVCSADGSSYVDTSCSGAQKCLAGICVTQTCGGTTQKCGWNTVLTCSSKAWATTACKTGELCDPTSFTCKARACDGSATQCSDDNTAAICSPTGDAWIAQACGAGQGCFDGICHAQVNGTAVDDTGDGSTDGDTTAATDVAKDGIQTLELPPHDIQLDAVDLFQCIVSQSATAPDGATPMVFSNASAVWLSSLGTLQITGAEGTQKVEIQVGKITELQAGNFTFSGAEAPNSVVGYSDGTGTVTGGKFQYNAADYTINLTHFGAVGDRIQGTFSAQVVDANGNKLWLLDGQFDIKR